MSRPTSLYTSPNALIGDLHIIIKNLREPSIRRVFLFLQCISNTGQIMRPGCLSLSVDKNELNALQVAIFQIFTKPTTK